ncbi:Ca2+:H+ antiporter [Rhodospirillales bacterium URHD0017]|nr:Ca2+:H+ antiporter [Rhodospirillales bacterium URHD0017]
MATGRKRWLWRAMPPAGLAVAMAATAISASAAGSPVLSVLLPLVGLAVLLGVVFACVHHADVIAHRTGEPYGTLVLTIAVTVIEVALILSIMLAGDGKPTLARETVFSVIMVVCNGVVGLCIILGGLRYGEQGFQVPGINAYLVVLIPLATITLILPTYTTSVPGPYYTPSQLAFVALATLLLYGVFLYVQTVRHRNYFLSDLVSSRDDGAAPESRQVWESVVMLLIGLLAVVLLAKSVAGSIETVVSAIGAPVEAVGLLVALLVLLPETVAALSAARRNELQKSLNLALGSSLATIGLTIPAVSILAVILKAPLELGVDLHDTVLLVLTFAVSMVTFGGGRTNILPGFVHLALFAIFVFLVFVP